MKKLLYTFILVTAGMTSSIYAAENTDSVGRLGVGYQATLLDHFFAVNQIAVRYAPKPVGGALVIGQGRTDERDGTWAEDSDHFIL